MNLPDVLINMGTKQWNLPGVLITMGTKQWNLPGVPINRGTLFLIHTLSSDEL